METHDDELVEVAMAIILAAGDARQLISTALNSIDHSDGVDAERLLDDAKAKIKEGHQAQTATIQGEAQGNQTRHSLLFAHAQDTLMVVMSEHNIAKHLVRLFSTVNVRLNRLELKGNS